MPRPKVQNPKNRTARRKLPSRNGSARRSRPSPSPVSAAPSSPPSVYGARLSLAYPSHPKTAPRTKTMPNPVRLSAASKASMKAPMPNPASMATRVLTIVWRLVKRARMFSGTALATQVL